MIKSILAKLNKYAFLVIALFLLVFLNSFVSGQIQNYSRNSFDKGQTFIKGGGWAIPSLTPSKTTIFTQKVVTKAKKKVTVTVTDYELQNNIVTDEPFASIKKDFGQNQYLTIREYKIKNRIFSYKIQVTPVSINKTTGAITSIGGLFYFAFYDEDGDGKFETLALDETISGISSFINPPHIPQWLLK